MPASRRDKAIINLSLQVLREALDRASTQTIQTTEVRLALRCLLPHCPERWPLTSFWSSAESANEIGRWQGCNASLNGIMLQLKAAGWDEG